ncbi:MAG: calcium-translocating P-type ATPase, PMCA-type [Clostridia bacterium]|nr:calcium-translocating P-type ATPase, PMCA-type [Clostridia bacterium]
MTNRSKESTVNGHIGLDDAEVRLSRERHGANTLTKQKGKSFLRHFVGNLGDPVIKILLGALAVKLVLLFRESDKLETVGIAAAILLATLISTLSEYGSARAFERLSEESANIRCRVRRGGTVREVALWEVVVGDIVLLDAGEMIPADGFLISGELRADQSAMTGESREIAKRATGRRESDPAAVSALFRGCTVTAGSGEMEVTAVGDKTFLGAISGEIQMEQRESPMRLRLSKLARQISRLGYVAAVLVALAYLFNVFVLDSGFRAEVIRFKISNVGYLFSELLHAFTLGLTVLVVAVPEGLPMMIAVVLSSNIRRMVRDKVLVRKAVGIEAAGSMSILFTDKTGTLTEGRMCVTSILAAGCEEVAPADLMRGRGEYAELVSLALRASSNATEGEDGVGARCALGGNATDRALLESVLSYPAPTGVEIVSRLPFTSDRKYAAVSIRGRRRMTFVSGAPERILPFVQYVMQGDGSIRPFLRSQTEATIRKMTVRGARVLVIAIAREGGVAESLASGIPSGLTLLCGVCISDPLRAEAKDSVAQLSGAGVQVVMITGDNKETAASIATGCGIINSDRDVILTSDELARLNDGRLIELLPRLAVVARALPTDKSRLVRVAQEAGRVVGMTGDGINDAPALKRADIGFAMGGGTQVAKDAGDIIILDNNLASIVRAVLYGRNIFKSIRKFITLQLMMNFYAVGVTMICPFLGIDSPVTVVQMLWINLIMDTLGGLAFAGEPALPECMKEKPKRRDEPILNRYMVNQIAFCGGFTVVLCLLFLKSPFFTAMFRPAEDEIYLLTAFFAFFIFASVFNCFNARTDRLNLFAGLRKNPVFILIMCAILVIQIAFVYLGGTVLRTAPLTARELLVTMSLSLAVFPVELIRKLIWRLRGHKRGY